MVWASLVCTLLSPCLWGVYCWGRMSRSELLELLEDTLGPSLQESRLVQVWPHTFELLPGGGERILKSAVARLAADGRKGKKDDILATLDAW